MVFTGIVAAKRNTTHVDVRHDLATVLEITCSQPGQHSMGKLLSSSEMVSIFAFRISTEKSR